ncbi:putative TBC1 domain family member 2B [Apostichopus japonicus]|uniref:Putative TBC1 domain family member 2B n=1 Tax=Stichopus japonicus TaxID=307972 RepID=A0A2G8LED1_STIJA|nr:putative TBC1 domain family member 2B [Apostichopus japonicus]
MVYMSFLHSVEGRVYQLQAEDYHTKMYWLQELQERRKCFSQLRTSLARDSTKRSSVEPSTGLVSTKKMKEKGGDPWAGLPPLLQPVTTPIHSVGEEAAVSTKGGISFNSLKNTHRGYKKERGPEEGSASPDTLQSPALPARLKFPPLEQLFGWVSQVLGSVFLHPERWTGGEFYLFPVNRSSPRVGKANILSLASNDGQRMEDMTLSLLAFTDRVATRAN